MINITSKQKRFCEEYIVDDNGAQAAIRAGYSKNSAATRAYETLNTPGVKETIDILRAERTKRLEITADKVLEQYRRLAFTDVNDYYCFKYDLVTNFGTTTKDKRKRERLLKYIGVTISEDEYNELPKHYKHHYRAYKTHKELDELTVEQRAGIENISYDKHGNMKYKIYNREKSLEMLGKNLQLFVDKSEVHNTGETVQRIININPTKGK